jgi:hypothetical protein
MLLQLALPALLDLQCCCAAVLLSVSAAPVLV